MTDDMLLLGPDSALDLTIKGSVGTFAIRSANAGPASSIPVTYLESHLGFALEGDSDERILQHLAPVREVFRVNELDFSQLMQRDIDDARVSLDLIPYLLEDDGDALVKLFPPIIVVVLPTDRRDRPAHYYPPVEEHVVQDANPQRPVKWKVIRSGPVGGEAFEFRQMVGPTGIASYHDYAQLKINTTKCRLAIVDGQHRAMALLALYRNYKSWPEGSLHYADYYKRWSRSVIERYDLSQIRLPILFCTFPSLHEDNKDATATTTEACRSVFLALNKNAKPVTRSRNHLLDDRDLIAYFLRGVLESVKSQDPTSSLALRIWDFELDSEGDRRVISSEMAISGVMHLYGAIEFLMLNKRTVDRLAPPRQNFHLQKDLTDCIRRLGAKEALGKDRTERANRQLIERGTAGILSEAFQERYGRLLIRALDQFWPYRAHCETALSLEAKLSAEAYGKTYHSVLFEGQGIGRVFDNYVDQVSQEVKDIRDASKPVPPELLASYNDFVDRSAERGRIIEDFYRARAHKFLGAGVSAKWTDLLLKYVQELYRRNFLTEAFQSALLITFFLELELVETARDTAGQAPVSPEDRDALFDEYISQLNGFFKPERSKDAWAIIRVFIGDVAGGHGGKEPVIAPSSKCLRRILVPGELKPDEWTKFRYVLLELWQPSNEELLARVKERRLALRSAAARAYEERELDAAARREGKLLVDLDSTVTAAVSAEAMRAFCSALKTLGVSVEPAELHASLPEEPEVEADLEDDGVDE